MRKKSLKLCGFTVIMGIFGAFLRWLQIQNTFDSETDLFTAHSPWSYALIVFLVLFAILLFRWVRGMKDLRFPSKYPDVYSENLPFASISAVVIGVIMAVGGAATILRSVRSSQSAFDLVLGFVTFISAAGLATFIISAGKPEKKTGGQFGAVCSVFYICFWLIAAYKFSAAEPAIWAFAPKLISLSAVLLAFYFIAGFMFNKPRPLSALYFSLLSAFLCIITLADLYPIGEKIITVGIIIALMLLSFSQISSANSRN